MNGRYPVEELENRIGYSFKDKELLMTALTHSSFRNETGGEGTDDYERQEYLGDAVLELTISDHVFRTHPEMREGQMTSLRASIVCEPTLARCAKEIGLPDHIRLGKGEDRNNSRNKDSIVSDVFEALIGGIYLDGGMDKARAFIADFVLKDIEHKILFHDSKTHLQNLIQARNGKLEYETVAERGPEHAKIFTVAVIIDGKKEAVAEGNSKKHAEQNAAYEALKKLREI
jgi:ribonuclease-3